MPYVRTSPARLLTVLSLSLVLAFTLLVGQTLSPAAPRANAALVSAKKADAAADWAATRRGMAYAYGGVGPRRFDCSGLTRWVYAKVGKALPHNSAAQVDRTKRISRDNRRRGDLVFFYSRTGIYHVGIYAGKNAIIHASRPGTPVQRSKIWTSKVFYGRVK